MLKFSKYHSLRFLKVTSTKNIQCRKIHVFRSVPELRAFRRSLRNCDSSLGLVPTLGALHKGHLSLARAAANENSDVVISIYLNPAQFGVAEDLDKYPQTFDSDLQQLHALNQSFQDEGVPGRVTAVFAPDTKTMYPTLPPTSEVDGSGSFVTITPLGQILEGASRPVFFRGVATICMKLFNIVQAERVYFGQKDAQQSLLIKRLVKDFHLDTEVRVIPTEREADNLARSSRNVYLGQRRRIAATMLPDALRIAEMQYLHHGKLAKNEILTPAYKFLTLQQEHFENLPDKERVSTELDYLSIADPEDMHELVEVDPGKGAIISGALKMLPLQHSSSQESLEAGTELTRNVRLIDNIVLKPQY